jgi:hypothetical protein
MHVYLSAIQKDLLFHVVHFTYWPFCGLDNIKMQVQGAKAQKKTEKPANLHRIKTCVYYVLAATKTVIMEQEVTILEGLLPQNAISRRQLLPIWIKVFIWLFMLTGAITPLIFIMGLNGADVQMSLYGLETMQPISVTGLTIAGLFLFKGIAAFGLWTEKDWAIAVAKADAVLGIAACIFINCVLPAINSNFSFRIPLELALLIPYLIKLNKVQYLWLRRDAANTGLPKQRPSAEFNNITIINSRR